MALEYYGRLYEEHGL
jgi:hypothetical protein